MKVCPSTRFHLYLAITTEKTLREIKTKLVLCVYVFFRVGMERKSSKNNASSWWGNIKLQFLAVTLLSLLQYPIVFFEIENMTYDKNQFVCSKPAHDVRTKLPRRRFKPFDVVYAHTTSHSNVMYRLGYSYCLKKKIPTYSKMIVTKRLCIHNIRSPLEIRIDCGRSITPNESH